MRRSIAVAVAAGWLLLASPAAGACYYGAACETPSVAGYRPEKVGVVSTVQTGESPLPWLALGGALVLVGVLAGATVRRRGPAGS